jgi:glycosyltransferase involved in cell wall biosynthesis
LPIAIIRRASSRSAFSQPRHARRSFSITRRWIVTAIGAREHYAIPRALQAKGQLKSFHPDIWCRHFRGLLKRGPSSIQSLASRWHADIPASRVISHSIKFARFQRGQQKIAAASKSPTAAYDMHLTIGRAFAEQVNRDLRRHRPDPATDLYFGYDTGCLETLEYLNTLGVPSIVDQIDPARTEYDIIREESANWAGWAHQEPAISDAYFDRLTSEWAKSSCVVVNSNWSRTALISQGVPAEKIVVIALAYEHHGPTPSRQFTKDQPLKVLWLGSVILRKGIQYLIEAAKKLTGEPVTFTIAGPLGISEMAVKSAPPNMKFLGRITRDRAPQLYADADIFVLPTVSDGFAITQLEAMAQGLPVITTPNCGDVVTDGVDGFIVPARSIDPLAAMIAELAHNRTLLATMSTHAFRKSQSFTLTHLADALTATAGRLAK